MASATIPYEPFPSRRHSLYLSPTAHDSKLGSIGILDGGGRFFSDVRGILLGEGEGLKSIYLVSASSGISSISSHFQASKALLLEGSSHKHLLNDQ
jgi:hypothetical protein